MILYNKNKSVIKPMKILFVYIVRIQQQCLTVQQSDQTRTFNQSISQSVNQSNHGTSFNRMVSCEVLHVTR